MEREYQSGHLTVLLGTTGTGIPGSSLTAKKRMTETPVRAVRRLRRAEGNHTSSEVRWLSTSPSVDDSALPAVIRNATPVHQQASGSRRRVRCVDPAMLTQRRGRGTRHTV